MTLSDPVLKRALIVMSVFFGITISLFIVLNLVFVRKNNHDEARWGQVHLQVSHDFSQHQRQVIDDLLPELGRLGPTFTTQGCSGIACSPPGERVVIIESATLAMSPGNCTQNGVGRWTQDRVEIDPTCTHGDLEFQTVMMHEIGHALGMGHVCRRGEVRTDCSPVGRGPAVMNPSLGLGGDEVPGFDRAFSPSVPVFQIQNLDVQEFLRVTRPPATN